MHEMVVYMHTCGSTMHALVHVHYVHMYPYPLLVVPILGTTQPIPHMGVVLGGTPYTPYMGYTVVPYGMVPSVHRVYGTIWQYAVYTMYTVYYVHRVHSVCAHVHCTQGTQYHRVVLPHVPMVPPIWGSTGYHGKGGYMGTLVVCPILGTTVVPSMVVLVGGVCTSTCSSVCMHAHIQQQYQCTSRIHHVVVPYVQWCIQGTLDTLYLGQVRQGWLEHLGFTADY